jgi:hypothetical protein
MSTVGWQRVALGAIAVAVGWMSLPLTALLLDTVVPDLLLPIALLGTVGICAAAGAGLRQAAGPDASARRGAAVGALAGLAAAIVSYVALFVLITGLGTGGG